MILARIGARAASCALLAGAALLLPVASGDAPGVRHLVDETVVEAGRSRVIAFEAVPAESDRTLPAQVGDGAVLRVLRAPAVLAGERLGFCRIAGVSPGTTRLHVAGAALRVRVVAPRGTEERPAPRITSPGRGAVTWGAFAASVELLDPPGATAAAPARVTLQLPDGRELEPEKSSDRDDGPTRRFEFRLPAGTFRPGPVELHALAHWPGGEASFSEPLTFRWLTDVEGRVQVWEGEARNTRERPRRFGPQPPVQGTDSRCSGNRFAAQYGNYRATCAEVTAPAGGAWYQVMVRAAGTPAYGALPTLGLHVDDAFLPVTNGRLAAERFHRVPVGVPFFLAAGAHFVSTVNHNRFRAGQRLDRVAYVDTVEILRLDGPAARNGARSAGMRGAGAMPGMAMPGMTAPGDGGGAKLPDLRERAAGGLMPAGAPVAAMPVAGMPDGHVLVAPSALRVAFTRAYDGDVVPGGLMLRGLCWWAGANGTPAPEVTLLLNGRPVQTQQAPDPRFFVDAPRLRQGANTLQLVARLANGATAFTPVQTVVRTGPPSTAERVDFFRYSVHDDRWSGRMQRRLRQHGGLPGHRLAAFGGNGAEVLELPVTLAGKYRVVLEAQGDHFQGAPVMRVVLERESDKTRVGDCAIKGWRTDNQAGVVDLAYGAKRLRVAFINDKREAGKGDRNIWLAAVRLDPVDGPGPAPPAVTVAYPAASGHTVWQTDAVVARVEDDRLVSGVELLIDGQPTGQVAPVGARTGLVVLPLLARGLAPGEHTVAVRVHDYARNHTQSAMRTITVAAGRPDRLGAYARAVRLLNRLAYGVEPAELGRLLAWGESAWLDARLRHGSDAGLAGARATATLHFRNWESQYEVPRRAVHTSLLDPNPVRARFRAFVENHFTTWIRKVQGPAKQQEHDRFAALGIAPFPQLLWASATSPTMLAYLDQTRSFAGRLNENYARELMELHTLGVHGGYSQADVTKLSALITGWGASADGDGYSGGRVRGLTFRFEPLANDERPQRIFGYAFPAAGDGDAYDRVAEAIEFLAGHPATARFIARKMAEHYVAVPAPDGLVADLAQVYLRTHGDMAAVLRAIAGHPAFWSPTLRPKLATPLDYSLRLSRTSGWMSPWGVGDFLDRSGMGMFDRETPDGYPEEDQAWADSNALIQRWKLADAARWSLAAFVPSRWRYATEVPAPARRQQIVDAIAVQLTGHPLGERSNAAAVELLGELTGNTDRKCQEIAIFIARLPEANLR